MGVLTARMPVRHRCAVPRGARRGGGQIWGWSPSLLLSGCWKRNPRPLQEPFLTTEAALQAPGANFFDMKEGKKTESEASLVYKVSYQDSLGYTEKLFQQTLIILNYSPFCFHKSPPPVLCSFIYFFFVGMGQGHACEGQQTRREEVVLGN